MGAAALRRRGAFLAVMGLLGCSESAPSGDVMAVDSAGVSVVTNGEQQVARAARWRLGSSPALWVRSEDNGVTLFEVTALAPTGSGRIAVLNRGTDEVLLFDGQGRYVARHGGEGDGPGEFRSLSSVLPLSGDSLGVYDSGHKRMSIFGPDGRLGREFTLSGVDGDFEKVFALPGGGFAVFAQSGMRDATPGVFRPVSESFSIDPEGARNGSFGDFPGAELFIGRVAGMVLFGANSYAALVGDELVVGTATGPELTFHGNDAKLRRIVRWPDHDRRVTDQRVEEFIATAEAALPEAARARAREIFREVPRSETYPAFEDVLASPEGELWVGEYRGPEMVLPGARSPERDWLVFDSRGVAVGRVTTPAGFQPLHVATNEVLGVYVDEVGVESIQVYDVLREPAEGNDS